jgi:diamine N-acetyltransferase
VIDYIQPTADDAAALSAMAEQAFTATFAHLYPPADLAVFLHDWMPVAKVTAQIVDPAYTIRLARDADGIIGYLKLGPIDFALPGGQPGDAAIELHHLYVLARGQGSGVAQALMDWALAEARARGARHIYLSVFVDNYRAQRFYTRHGFYEVGKNIFMVGTVADDDRIWRCDL